MINAEANQKNFAIQQIDQLKGGLSTNYVIAKPDIDEVATDQNDYSDTGKVEDVFKTQDELNAFKKKQLWTTLIISFSMVLLFVILVKYKVIKL